MRLLLAIALGLSALSAQTCVPQRMMPVGSVKGTIDASSCGLSDSTGYNAYRLDLPTRGQIQVELNSGAADLILILRDDSGAKTASGVSIHTPIEAGSYILLVAARIAGQAGAYTVATAFQAEPGMLCDNYPNVGLTQSVAGRLGATGCQSPNGTLYEAYTLTTFGAGTLTATVASNAFAATVALRSDDARLLAWDSHSVVLAVSAGTKYQVVVSTTDGAGDYQLTTSFQPAPSETCRAQKSLNTTSMDGNTINAVSCVVTIDGSGDQAYYNYYNVVIPTNGRIDLAVSSSDFNPTLVLMDAAGNTLATDSDGDPYSFGQSHAEVRLHLSAGTYTAAVFSDVASGGDYRLIYAFTAGLPKACPALGAIAPTINGALSASSCRTVLGLSDIYHQTLTSAGRLDISATSSNFIPALAIRDTKDNLIVISRDEDGLGVAHITADLPAGGYTIVVAAISSVGLYQMTSSFVAREIAQCTYATPLLLNSTYYQTLGPTSCRGVNGQAIDMFSFTLPSDGVIAGVVASSDIDGYLTLTDSAGNVLRTDDNTYGSNNPLIVQFLPAGTYRLTVRDAEATSGGPYALALYAALGPRPPFCLPRGRLGVGATLSGNISSTGCQYLDNTLADLYQVDLAYDATIDLRLNSGDFDAYLILLDANGDLVGQDDDGGGGTNARVTKAVKAGTYYVVAKPFSDYFSQGNYKISLTAQ